MTADNFRERVLLLEQQVREMKIENYSETNFFYRNLIEKNLIRYGRYSSSHAESIIYFIDGPIGSGKSTILKNYIFSNKLFDLLYYSPEAYAKVVYDGEDFMVAYNEAKAFLWEDLRKRIHTRESVIIESVFCKESKLDLLRSAKKLGYRLVGIYVGTQNFDIPTERTHQRFMSGAHFVPKEKIIDRYWRSIKFQPAILSISNEYMIVDNTEKPLLVAYKHEDQRHVSSKSPNWIKKLFEQ